MKTKYKVLHLEDVQTDAELVARELRKNNIDFEHHVIDTEDEYLSALDHFAPDIILCDHSLPSFNSLEAIKIIKKKKLHIPFILITATMSEDVAMGVVREGADDYILKDRLKRLPNTVLNNIEKYRFEKERKQLVDEAHEKEALSKALFQKLSNKLLLATQKAGIGVWEYSLEEDTFIYDDVLLSIYQITPDQFDGTFDNWLQFLHPEDRERIKADFDNALKECGDFDADFRIITKDQTVRFIKATIFTQCDETGRITQILGTNQDITASKKAEMTIKESEAKYRSFFENSMDGILITRTGGDIIAANPAACAIFNTTEDQLTANSENFELLDFTDPATRAIIDERNIKGTVKGEVNFIRKDGSKFPGDFTSSIFTDGYGDENTYTIIRDTTDRKLAEQNLIATSNALKIALNEVEKIMTSSIDIICSTDKDGRFVVVSAACESILGYSPAELMGKKYIDLVMEEDVEKTIAVAKKILDGHPVTIFENRFIHKNGSIVPVLWSAKWDENENLMYSIGKDATEKKLFEKAFENERQRFHELFLHAPCSVGVFKGRDYVFEMANKFYLQLTGRQDIIGKTLKEVFPELQDQGIFELLDEVYSTGQSITANERLIRIDKVGTGKLTNLYLNFTYQAYRNNQNEIEGIFFFAVDVTEQVEARKKVEESEKKFRELILDLPEAVYTCNTNGEIMLYNKAAEALWGRKPEIGKELWCGSDKIFHANGATVSKATLPMALAMKNKKSVFKQEMLIEKPNGEKRYVVANPIPLFDQDENLTGAVNMLVDITHLKLVEEKLRASNERYEIVTRATNDAIWDWNLVTNEIYWNKSYERLFGYKRSYEQIDVHTWMRTIHQDDRDRVKQGIYNVIHCGGKHWQDEYKYIKQNGDVAKVLDRGYLIYDEQNKPIRFVGAMQDITDRKLTEEKLRENQEQLLASQRIAHIGSWQMNFIHSSDINSNPIFCSEETFRIFGFPANAGEVSFEDFSHFIHPKDISLIKTSFEEAVANNSSYAIDFRIFDRSGNKRWVHQEAKLLTDPTSGKPSKMFGTIKDITTHKEQELQILRNTEEREILIGELTKSITDLKQFSYITSHNFRAPLSNLVGLLSLIDNSNLDENNKQIIDLFRTATNQLNKTINDLVKILIIKNNVNVQVANNNLEELLDEVCNSLSYELAEFDCCITRDLQVSNVVFNQAYLQSILLNFISNSIKYRSPNRALKIDVSTSKTVSGEVLITISDNGLGIDLKRHGNNIFGLYQRFHSEVEGAGLGLFMVKSQITSLGGKIKVESEEDKGTTFYITLKMKDQEHHDD